MRITGVRKKPSRWAAGLCALSRLHSFAFVSISIRSPEWILNFSLTLVLSLCTAVAMQFRRHLNKRMILIIEIYPRRNAAGICSLFCYWLVASLISLAYFCAINRYHVEHLSILALAYFRALDERFPRKIFFHELRDMYSTLLETFVILRNFRRLPYQTWWKALQKYVIIFRLVERKISASHPVRWNHLLEGRTIFMTAQISCSCAHSFPSYPQTSRGRVTGSAT